MVKLVIRFVCFVVFCGVALTGCTSSHSFTINAESIDKPSITYGDSVRVVNPFSK